MTRYKTMGISSFLSVPDKAAKRFRPAIRRSAWTRLALVGALFVATHTHANETRQVVSSNGTTNTVERIDFPVGDIKDIIPAGDKYIIHANPIDSLKDSVAVDALFVMEKANPNAAFGRTFSDEITSVAYVPSLDMAVWSYKTQRNADLMEIKQGRSALHAAGSNTNYIANAVGKVSNDVMLFASPSNTVYEIGNYIYGHGFRLQNNEYTEYIALRSGSLGKNNKLAIANPQGVFTLEPSIGRVRYTNFDKGSHFSYVSEAENATSVAAIPDGENSNDGHLIVGDAMGMIRSYSYVIDSCNEVPNGTNQVLNTPINNMALTQNNTVQMVSTNNNTVAEIDDSMVVLDRMAPNPQETGYRKVISDGNSTLLLSNTHSNYFYRIQKTR